MSANISKNKSTWAMAILNIIASIIIANGGISIAQNKTEISNGVSNIAVLHKRISEQKVEIAKLVAQVDWLKDAVDNLSQRVDRLAKK